MIEPYAQKALDYQHSGLGWPIPSTFPFEKFPPLQGWTGRRGHQPDDDQVLEWTKSYAQSNILLRLKPNVIGIDVDSYDDKQGLRTLGQLQAAHGYLPPTWRSSARGSGVSGIRFYRLRMYHEESKLRDPGEHIEVIRYSHRYAVVPASWHQGANQPYQWYLNDEAIDRMPTAVDLPTLPDEWYVHLTRGCECFELERAERRLHIDRLRNRPVGAAGATEARKDLDKAITELLSTSAGGRNNMLSSIAGRFLLYDTVMHRVLDVKEVCVLLLEAGIEAGLEENETERTIESALEWALREGKAK